MNAPHELIAAFAQQHLMLHKTLSAMLNEEPAHRTLRRGCGLTQATRFLAEYINRPRNPLSVEDLALIQNWPKTATLRLAKQCYDLGWQHGWRSLAEAPLELLDNIKEMPSVKELLALPAKFKAIAQQLEHEESHLLLVMIENILATHTLDLPQLPLMQIKVEIGSCSQAEEYFLEIAHGRIRRGGSVNIWLDEQRCPVLIEKINLGESHSAIFIQPVSIGSVTIPAGALGALRYAEHTPAIAHHPAGNIHSLSQLTGVQFLRLTTLSVAPQYRNRAFSSQFQQQITQHMLSPKTTTLEHLQQYAQQCLLGQ